MWFLPVLHKCEISSLSELRKVEKSAHVCLLPYTKINTATDNIGHNGHAQFMCV